METVVRTFSLSELNRQPGEVVDAALAAPVTLEKRGKPRLVMMSVEAYERMASLRRSFTIENAPDWVHEELMTGLEELLSENDDDAQPR